MTAGGGGLGTGAAVTTSGSGLTAGGGGLGTGAAVTTSGSRSIVCMALIRLVTSASSSIAVSSFALSFWSTPTSRPNSLSGANGGVRLAAARAPYC